MCREGCRLEERDAESGTAHRHLFPLGTHRCSIPKHCGSSGLARSVATQSPTQWTISVGSCGWVTRKAVPMLDLRHGRIWEERHLCLLERPTLPKSTSEWLELKSKLHTVERVSMVDWALDNESKSFGHCSWLGHEIPLWPWGSHITSCVSSLSSF